MSFRSGPPRLLACLVFAFSLPGLAPYQAAALVFSSRRPAPVARVSAGLVSKAALLNQHRLPARVLEVSAPLGISPAETPGGPDAAPQASGADATPPSAQPLKAAAERINLAPDPAEAAAQEELNNLFAERTLLRADGTPVYAGKPAAAEPSGLTPTDPETQKRVRSMIAGTAAMKIGMETVTLSVPLLSMIALGGGATMVAGLMVAYSLAQALCAGAVGGLMDRLPEQKVLAGAVLSQAILVGAIIGLGAAGALNPWTLFPLYTLVGGAVGIAETSRHAIAPRILGQDPEALARYNARLHIFYEVSGVAGAKAAGKLLSWVGPLGALALQPPAYLAGAWFFWRVKLAKKDPPGIGLKAPALSSLRERWREYVRDVKAGYKLVVGDHRLRWVAVASVLPQILHRILEGLFIPVYAKDVLMDPGAAGDLLAASNLGELIGAVLLLRLASRIKAPAWIKWGAAAIALVWTLAFTHALPVAFFVILAMGMTWSASDLSLRSEIQSSLGEKDQPRASSFLYGTFVLASAAASLALGALIDSLPMTTALYAIFAIFTAMGVAVWIASRRLSAPKS